MHTLNDTNELSTAERLASGEALDANVDALRLMASHDLMAAAGAVASIAAIAMSHAPDIVKAAIPEPGEVFGGGERDPAEIADTLRYLAQHMAAQLMALRELAVRHVAEGEGGDGLVPVSREELDRFVNGGGPVPVEIAKAIRAKLDA